jgi:hypothetical protein
MRCRLPAGAIAALALAAAPLSPSDAQDAPAAQPGVALICLAPATVEAAPGGVDPGAAVRDAFTTLLSGPTLAVQPLASRLPSQARAEARLSDCGFLLLTTVKHERKTGGGGILGKLATGAVQEGTAAVSVSAGGSAVGRVAAGAAADAANGTVGEYATSSRQKDELVLSYRLESTGGRALLEDSEKRKAKTDGEDLLTPLAQRAAEAIADAVSQPSARSGTP